MPGWASPARPAVYKPPVGARVASPQSPILRWSTPRVSALDWATSGLSKSPLLIARPLLLTTNCPLLLTTAVRFCSHRDSLRLEVRRTGVQLGTTAIQSAETRNPKLEARNKPQAPSRE